MLYLCRTNWLLFNLNILLLFKVHKQKQTTWFTFIHFIRKFIYIQKQCLPVEQTNITDRNFYVFYFYDYKYKKKNNKKWNILHDKNVKIIIINENYKAKFLLFHVSV